MYTNDTNARYKNHHIRMHTRPCIYTPPTSTKSSIHTYTRTHVLELEPVGDAALVVLLLALVGAVVDDVVAQGHLDLCLVGVREVWEYGVDKKMRTLNFLHHNIQNRAITPKVQQATTPLTHTRKTRQTNRPKMHHGVGDVVGRLLAAGGDPGLELEGQVDVPLLQLEVARHLVVFINVGWGVMCWWGRSLGRLKRQIHQHKHRTHTSVLRHKPYLAAGLGDGHGEAAEVLLGVRVLFLFWGGRLYR